MATIIGTPNDDDFSGTSGADSLTGSAGNDTLDGGAGLDTAVYAGNASDYRFGWSHGLLTVTDLNAANGDEGTDYLSGIESLQFADRVLSVKPGGESKVSTLMQQSQSLPNITGLADGGWLVSWQSYDPVHGGDILSQRYSAAGEKVGGEITVAPSNYDQSYSDVAGLADGGWVVTWDSYREDGDNGGIYARRFSAAGEAIGDQFRVNAHTVDSQNNPTVTALNDGGWLVVWISRDAGGNNFTIDTQRYNAAGTAVGGTQANTTTGNNQIVYYSSDVTALKDGGWLVTWHANQPGDNRFDVYSQRFDAAGNRVGGEILVNTTTFEIQYNPAATALNDGGWLVTWTSFTFNLDAGNDIHFQRYNALGEPVGSETLVNSLFYANQDQNFSAVTALADGGWVVTWLSGGSLDGDALAIYSQRYNAAGQTVGGETLVNTTTQGSQALAKVASLSDGGWAVTWMSVENGNQDHDGIYVQRFNADGTATRLEVAGSSGNDTLNGEGYITLVGGAGSDTYIVTDNLVQLREAGNAGTDMVKSSVSWVLGANLENLMLIGTGAINGTGNNLNNTIYAGAGDNVLNGGAGTDTLSYVYATAAVTVSLGLSTEQATGGSGLDTVTGFEKLVGSHYNDSLTGNSAANTLTGGLGNDTLNGGGGADQMIGGDGSDTYYVDNTGDTVSETNALASSGGTDTVYSYLSAYTLGSNVENLRLLATGTASGTGNSLDNTLYAGAGNNVLNGGDGTDTLSYAFATAAVKVSLALTGAQATGGSGSDTVLNVENLAGSDYNDSLTGSSAANTLTGGLGKDTLNGGAGADQMIGGDGSDTYYVDNAGDTVIETNAVASSGGTDIVYSYLSAYTLSSNVENLRLMATGAADGTGNSLNNTLYAGAGNNVLKGGAGTDTLSYVYASAAVKVSLALSTAQATGGSGTDTVSSVENLVGSNYNDTLIGSSAANTLTGGLGNDTLNGGAGNDVLIGGAGADKLYGGSGADRFDFNALSEMGLGVALRDVIGDFNSSAGDKIDLSTLDADPATSANEAFAFIGGDPFSSNATGQLRFADGILYGSLDADSEAEFEIQLLGVSGLQVADLIV